MLFGSRIKMASRRITRETFDAVVQDKVKRYRMDRGDALENTIHHFKGNETGAVDCKSYSGNSFVQFLAFHLYIFA